MASQHLILRTVCSGGGGNDAPKRADDQQEPSSPSTSVSSSGASSARHPPPPGRHPGQKVGRTLPTGTASSPNAVATKQRLELLPIWCDVTVLSEVMSADNSYGNENNNENSNIESSNDDDGTGVAAGGSSNNSSGERKAGDEQSTKNKSDAPHVVKRQRFNPCGMDNVLVFPSSSSSSSSTSSSSTRTISTTSTSTSTSHLLRLSSCWTSSSLLFVGGDDDASLLDLPVRPHPATLAFTTGSSGTSENVNGGPMAKSGAEIGTSSTNGNTGTALLTVEFDLRPAYQALEGIVAKKEQQGKEQKMAKAEEEKRLASTKRFIMWNPLSWWLYPNAIGGGNISGGIPTSRVELERMLDEMLVERSYHARQQQQRQHFEVGGGDTSGLFNPLLGREDLIILQAAMDREIRDLNIMLSGLGLMGLALVASYVCTVRRIWSRRPPSSKSALASGTATPRQQKRQRTSSAGSDAQQSCDSSFGDGVRLPPPIGTIQIVRDTVVQGLGMANIGDALRAAVGAGAASVSASFSPSKCDGESVSTAPSTPETPSPRAKKQGGERQRQRQVQKQELTQKEESPPEATEPMVAERKKKISPERKEIINALLARVKAPTPVKTAENEGAANHSTVAEKKMPKAVVATPGKSPAVEESKQKQTAGKATEEANAPITPIPTRKPMVGRKPVGGKVGGAFTSVPDDESSAAAASASNMTPDIFATTSRASTIGIDGILGGSSNDPISTPMLTPMRNKGGGQGGGSSKMRQSKSNANDSSDPRGSPSFAQMLVQKQQQLTPPKEEPSRKLVQGKIALGGSQTKKKKSNQQQHSKPRRKLTPPPKSKAGDASASVSGGFGDEGGNDTMIQGRNLNDTIENTFFRDYWDE